MSTLAGYQNVLGVDQDNLAVNTYVQILGLQAAISEMGVRYNWGAFSLGSNLNQRVLLPDYVLESGSGICIETTILLASAHIHAYAPDDYFYTGACAGGGGNVERSANTFWRQPLLDWDRPIGRPLFNTYPRRNGRPICRTPQTAAQAMSLTAI